MAKRLKVGDVLLLNAGSGVAYLQYLGRHSMYGDAILVGRLRAEPTFAVTPELLAGCYVTFYPANAARAKGLLSVVGNIPARPIPTLMRRPGAIVDRRVRTWIIEEGDRDTVKSTLSPEEIALPIASIWNHEFLIQRVTEGWNPCQSTDRP